METQQVTPDGIHCFLNGKSGIGTPYTPALLTPLWKDTNDQINDEIAIDVALEDISVITVSENEMSSNNQVVYMEDFKTNNSVIQFVRDNKDLNSVSIHGNTTPSTQWVGSKSTLRHHRCRIT